MNHKVRTLLFLIAAFLTLLLPISSVGQVLKGSISGTVVDPQNAVVSGAKVKATESSTGTVFNTTSDNAGLFRLNLIPAGTYKLEVNAQGFQTTVSNGIQVTAGADSGLGNLQLKIGETETTLEVNTAAPLIETSQAQVTNTFSGVALSSFAGIQENQGLDNVALFVPGVVSSRDNNFANINGGGGFAVNGIRGRNNDQEIDGQNNNDNSVAGPAAAQTDPEFVGQYVIITNNFGPEYGRNAGSVVNVITKSGSNVWHGSVYANENNSILNSLTSTQNSVSLKEPPRANDEFGGFTIGGPLVKNRAFFFGGFDQEIVSSSTVYSTGQLTPTPAGLATLAGCFPTGASANAVAALTKFGPYGISAGNPTPGANATTQNITDPTTGNTLCSNVAMNTVSRILPTPVHAFNWITKEDVNLSGSDNLSARYVFNRSDFFNTQDNGAAGYVVNIPALSQAVLLSETHNFSNRMVNELRFGFDRLNVEFGGNSIGTEPTTGNIQNAVSSINFLSNALLGYGVNAGLPQGRVVNTWQAQDNWNYVMGKHTLKAGVNWTYQQSPNIFLPFINGGYFFGAIPKTATTPGTDAFSAYVLNQPSFGVITQGAPELGLKEFDTFTYVGDDWKFSRNLTINLGLTYSYYGQPINQLHDLGVAQQQGPNPLWNPALPLSVTTPPAVPAYKKALGPSVGFAYSPQWGGFLTGHGKTVIRGGYRLSYDPSFYNILLNNYGGAPSVLQATVAAPPLPAVPTGPNVRPLLLSGIAGLGPLDPRNFGETSVGGNFRPDQVQSWSLGFERELTKSSAVEVRYVGNHAGQLFQTVNANPYVGFNGGAIPSGLQPGITDVFPNLAPNATGCTTPGFAGPDGTLASSPALGRVNCNQGVVLSRDNSAFSNYQAIQTEFRANNLFNQLTIRAGYTFSKTLDNTSEIFSSALNGLGAGNTFSLAQNPLNVTNAEYSLSGLDIPHQFSLTAQEQLPFFKGQHGALGHLLGGWNLSAAYIWESGQPFTPETSFFSAGGPNNFFDSSFLAANAGGLVPARPFLGSISAPGDSVGIFAGDACTNLGAGCSLASTQLISLNALNAPGGPNVQTVTNNQVRYIANAAVAETVFGTPFGNAPRNVGRDAPLNFLNASVTKNVKFNERASFELRFTALNALNHANFATVTPFVESAGTNTFGNAFALPQLTGDSIPGSNLAASRRFYVGGIFRF